VYYASEIDQDAINVTKMQHKDNIIHFGDVTLINVQKVGTISFVTITAEAPKVPCNRRKWPLTERLLVCLLL
jgi:site-specific DNA-cytosine methylase